MQTYVYGQDTVAGAATGDMLDRLGLGHENLACLSGLDLPSLLLVASHWLDEAVWAQITAYLESGGRVLFLQPVPQALPLVGDEEPLSYPFAYLKTDGTLGPFAHLQVLSPSRQVRQRHGQALAHFALDFSTTAKRWSTSYPALAWGTSGKGLWGVFLYDLPRTLLALHQGQPCFASTGDLPDPVGDGRFRSTHLVHGQVASALAETPQAHCHELLFLRLARLLCQGMSPLPRLWPLPYPHTSAMILSGDSDSLERRRLVQALETVAGWGLPYTLYIMPEDLAKFSRRELEAFEGAGADLALHYYHGAMPSVAEMSQGLAADVAAFVEKGLCPSSARGHSCIWVGWDEQARLLQEAGFQASSNFIGRLSYCTGTGLPYRFLSRAGERLELWELPIYCGDDISLVDKWGVPQLTAELALQESLAALRLSSELYYQPLTFIFHPHYFTGTQPATTPWLKGLAELARESSVPAYNVSGWLAFWQGRCRARLSQELVRLEAGKTGVHLSLRVPTADLAVAVPETWDGAPCRAAGQRLAGTGELLLSARDGMQVIYG
jgi:hypothetical protein